MTLQSLRQFFALAVQLLLLACVLATPVSAKTALGGYQPNIEVALADVAAKSLTVLDNFLSYKTKALGCCVGPDTQSTTPPKGPHGTTVDEEVSGIRNLGDENAGKVNTDRVRPVNDRNPINSQRYAGTTIPLGDLPSDIAKKYPKSVHFSGAGYPDFTPYATKKVNVELTGNRDKDFKLANQASGLRRTPAGFTWHHHQQSGLMQLIPSDLHDAVRHTGGVATSGIKPYK